jgi:hypothetical protein
VIHEETTQDFLEMWATFITSTHRLQRRTFWIFSMYLCFTTLFMNDCIKHMMLACTRKRSFSFNFNLYFGMRRYQSAFLVTLLITGVSKLSLHPTVAKGIWVKMQPVLLNSGYRLRFPVFFGVLHELTASCTTRRLIKFAFRMKENRGALFVKIHYRVLKSFKRFYWRV